MRKTVSIAILGMMLAIPAAAQDADTTVATVNGAPITLGEILTLHEGFPEGTLGADPQTVWDLLIDQLAQQEALAQQAEAAPTIRDQAAVTLSRRAYLAASALERVAAQEPDDDALKRLYAEIYDDAEPQPEYHAAHILVETQEAIEAVTKALADGREFAEVAEERSLDSTGPNGGDLGWFSADVMVEPFAEQVRQLEPGDTSDPFQTQFGWHVVQLIDTRLPDPPSFDESREELITLFRRQQVEAATDAALHDAKVERNPDLGADLLSRTDLLEE